MSINVLPQDFLDLDFLTKISGENTRKNNSKKSHLLLVTVAAAAPGAVSAAGVGVIAGGGGHHCGGRVARVSRVSMSIAGAGHGVHYIKQGQPEKQLQKH